MHNKNKLESPKNFIWDKWVRFTHWSVALICFANLFFTDEGSSIYRYIGYTAATLVFSRILWSFSFAKFPARFIDLIPRSSGFTKHLQALKQRKEDAVGHNAFGLLGVWAMWFCIFGLAITGYLSDSMWGMMNEIYEWHELLATSLEIIVVIHIFAVIVKGKIVKKNLLKTMKPFNK